MAQKKANKDKREPFIKRLRNHYKVVLLNIDTFEERFTLLLTPLNVIVIVGVSFLTVFAISFALLGWTPLRYYLPDFAEEVRVKKLAVRAAMKADSMELALKQRDQYIDNVRMLIEGRIDTASTDSSMFIEVDPLSVNYQPSSEDSAFRREMEQQDFVNLNPNFNKDENSSYLLFPPVKGTITDRFNVQLGHFGTDIAAPKDEPIKAVEDGTVVIAAYTAETGYLIQIQHDNDLVSIYKHNSTLMKKEGETVRAGEVIAIIGETGEYSSGPHLHFELWRNGVPLNPESFFSFE